MKSTVNDSQTSKKLPKLAVAAVITTLTMWASSYVVVRSIALEFSPSSLAFLRISFGALALTGIFFWLRRKTRKTIRLGAMVWSIPMGLLLFVGFTLNQNWAGQHIDAGTISILVNLAPLIVAVGAGLFLGEGFPRRLFAGIFISLAGIALIVHGSGTLTLNLTGVSAAILAALCYGAGMLTQKKALQYEDAIGCTWLACCVALLALSPIAPRAFAELGNVPPAVLFLVVYIGIGPMALGFWLWGYALTKLPTGEVAATSLLVPAIAILLSAIFLTELPPLIAVIGGALCIAGVMATQGLFHAQRRRN